MYASSGGHLATVQLLLRSGANVNAQTEVCYDTLHCGVITSVLETL